MESATALKELSYNHRGCQTRTGILYLEDPQAFSHHEASVKNKVVPVFNLSEFLKNFRSQACYCFSPLSSCCYSTCFITAFHWPVTEIKLMKAHTKPKTFMRQNYMYLLCQTTSKHFKYTLYHIKNTLSFNIWFEKKEELEGSKQKVTISKYPHASSVKYRWRKIHAWWDNKD